MRGSVLSARISGLLVGGVLCGDGRGGGSLGDGWCGRVHHLHVVHTIHLSGHSEPLYEIDLMGTTITEGNQMMQAHELCEISVWFFRKLKKMYSISKYFSCWEGLGYIKVVLHCTLQSWKVGCYAYCHQFASYSITLYLMLMDALKLDPILRGDLGSFSDIHGLFSSSRTDGATYVNPCKRYHICHQSIDGK